MKTFIIGLILSIVSFVSFAQAPPPSAIPTQNIESMSIINKVISSVIGNNFVTKFVNSGKTIAAKLNGFAMYIAGILALWALLWEVMQNMINKKSVLDGFLNNVIMAVLVVFLLQIYPIIVNDFMTLGTTILSLVVGGDIGLAVSNFISVMSANVFISTEVGLNSLTKLNIFDFLDAVVAFVFILAALFFALLATVEILTVALVGPVTFALGIALGPLFIATLVSKASSVWFKTWLGYMINSACLTAILGTLITLISDVVTSTGVFVATPSSTGNYLAADALSLALLCYILGKIFANTPAYADAMLPGRSGSSGASSGAGNAMIKGASATGKSAAKSASGGASAKAVTGAVAGGVP